MRVPGNANSIGVWYYHHGMDEGGIVLASMAGSVLARIAGRDGVALQEAVNKKLMSARLADIL